MGDEVRYTVRRKTAGEAAGWIGLILFLLLAVLLTWLNLLPGPKEAPETLALEYAAALGLAALCAAQILRERRPRVEVRGEELLCFPRGKRKRAARMGDITARRSFGRSSRGARYLEIAYYTGDGELIRLDTRMTNADRLDAAVKRRMGS